jgi:NAD+ kinase
MDEAGGQARTAGVVGDADGVAASLLAAGLRTVEGDTDSVLSADPAILVAVGEGALLELARRAPPVPILPVEAGRGVRSVPRAALPGVGERLTTGEWSVEEHPLLDLAWDGGETTAFFDAMLVTAGPADISEFTVRAGGEHVARFRADGVVATTPAGSPGYARTAGGPVVDPGLDVLVVVPVAPFATSLGHWVVPPEISLTVERDEAAVEVLADDRSAGDAPVGDPVRVAVTGRVDVVRVPEGLSPFGRRERELEKL